MMHTRFDYLNNQGRTFQKCRSRALLKAFEATVYSLKSIEA
jgi:hypothetical protein